MISLQRLTIEFKEFTKSVFPNAGEQQLSDLHTVWFAAILCAMQEVEDYDNTEEVHEVAFDVLEAYNAMCQRITGAA